jgi:hypothetical protein
MAPDRDVRCGKCQSYYDAFNDPEPRRLVQWLYDHREGDEMDRMDQPICGKCGKVMTPKDSRIHPEYFLHDACLPDKLKPQPEPIKHAHSITVEWLHVIRPEGWRDAQRGIDYANWTIHSIRSAEEGYNVGPFVWTVAPSHGPNLTPLERPCESHFAILVLETRQDVIRLLQLLVGDEWTACEHGIKDGDYCEECLREVKAARNYEENR